MLDSVGELASVYARAEVAFVGGTLVPVGGHNLLEPVFAGRPVLFGPHTENARQAVEILEASRRGNRAWRTPTSSRARWSRCCAIRARRGGAARKGGARSSSHRGSAERAAALIEALLARDVAARSLMRAVWLESREAEPAQAAALLPLALVSGLWSAPARGCTARSTAAARSRRRACRVASSPSAT